MTRAVPQSTITAAFTEVRRTREPKSITVLSQYGQGSLMLALRKSLHGVTAKWLIRFTDEQGNRDSTTIGDYGLNDAAGGMSRDMALAEFDAWRERRRQGTTLVKPSLNGVYMTAEEAKPVAPSQTVQALFDCYMSDYSVKHNTPGTVIARNSIWRTHCQAIAGIAARSLTAKMVKELALVPMIEAGHRPTAEAARKLLRAMYSAAAQVTAGETENYNFPESLAAFNIEVDPLASLKAIKGANKARNKPMNIDAIRATWPCIKDGLAGDLVRLSILTAGTRFKQVARLTRANIDTELGKVLLQDFKGRELANPRDYGLPLGPQGRVIAARAALALGRDGVAPSAWVLSRILSEAMEAAGVRTPENDRQSRDIRSTITTWLAGQGVPQAASNWIQSHELGTLVSKHYQGELEEQVRKALLNLEGAILGRVKGKTRKAA